MHQDAVTLQQIERHLLVPQPLGQSKHRIPPAFTRAHLGSWGRSRSAPDLRLIVRQPFPYLRLQSLTTAQESGCGVHHRGAD